MQKIKERDSLYLIQAMKDNQCEPVYDFVKINFHIPDLLKTPIGPQSFTLLTWAAYYNLRDLVQYFSVFADENALFDAMIVAVQNGCLEVCDIFLSYNTAKKCFQRVDAQGKNLAHHAAVHGQTLILLDILKHDSQVFNDPVDCPHHKDHGKNVLELAMDYGHETCALVLYQHGFQTLLQRENHVQAFIHLAAQKGYLECIQAYQDDGKDLNLLDKNQQSPLLWAASSGQLATVDYLINQRVELNSPEKKEWSYLKAPIFWAVVNGHTAVVKRLLEADADFEMNCWCYGSPEEPMPMPVNVTLPLSMMLTLAILPMATAGMVSAWLLVPTFIFCPNPKIQNNRQYTLLHIAAKEGYFEIVQLLCAQKNAEKMRHARDAQGNTASGLARKAGHYKVQQWIDGFRLEENLVLKMSEQHHYYYSGHIHREASFFREAGAKFVFEQSFGKSMRLFQNESTHRRVVESYFCGDGEHDKIAMRMRTVYPSAGAFNTFYFPKALINGWQGSVRFVRPYFEGEPAAGVLLQLEDQDQVYHAIEAIGQELARIHRHRIVLNQVQWDQVILRQNGSGYKAVYIDFSKSQEKSNSFILSGGMGSVSRTRDALQFAAQLRQFLYDHPKGLAIADAMPQWIDFIEASLDPNHPNFYAVFENLFTLSMGWVMEEREDIEADPTISQCNL